MFKRSLISGAAVLALAVAVPGFSRPLTNTIRLEVEKEVKIEIKDLPTAVTDAVKKAMPDGKITEAETEKKDGKTVYSLDVKVGEKEFDVVVSEDGKILKTEEDKDAAKEQKK